MAVKVLGILCHRNHDEGSGLSIRYLSGACVDCQKENATKRDPERSKASSYSWRKLNPERVRATRAKSYAKNQDKRRETSEAWRQKNKPRRAAYARKYRALNKPKFAAYESKRVRSPEQRAAFNLYRRRYAKDHPEIQQAAYQKRRAAMSINNTLTAKEIVAQRSLQDGVCWYCQNGLDNNGRGHIDHKTPLIRGGFNEATNIVIACSSCNLSKGQKTEEEFLLRRAK